MKDKTRGNKTRHISKGNVLDDLGFSCNCVDFRISALGTCKHIEATLLYLEARHRRPLPPRSEQW